MSDKNENPFKVAEFAMTQGAAARRPHWPEGMCIFFMAPIGKRDAYCVRTQDNGALGVAHGDGGDFIQCYIPTDEDRAATDWSIGGVDIVAPSVN